jgi:hypothetical protein
MNCLLDIKCDFVTAFKKIFKEKYKLKLIELAKQRNYLSFSKTIAVHLRLDDRADYFTTREERFKWCNIYIFRSDISLRPPFKTFTP